MAQPLTFDDQVVIVTGGGRGLGRQHALEFARRGARVVVNDLGAPTDGSQGDSAADDVVREIVAAGGQAVSNGHSVSSQESAAEIVQAALSAFGRVDVVVNNAGILDDRSFMKMDAAAVTSVMDVHFYGSFWLTHAAWPHMKEAGYGRVVMTTSVAGYYGNFGQTNYGSAKAALIGLTKTLAIEGERSGIRVNAVAPGARTRMTEGLIGEELAARMGPEFVSPVVVALAHSSCSLNGEVFSVAAGRVARVFTEQNEGIFDAELSAESVAASFGDLMADTRSAGFRTVADEMGYIRSRLESAGLLKSTN